MQADALFPLEVFSFRYVRLDRGGRVARQQAGQGLQWSERLPGGLALLLVALPGGRFQMGSERGQGYPDETPRHTAQVRPFCLGRQLVTQAQWRAVMKQAPRARFRGEGLPVENVSWVEALAFCPRLARYSGHPYRLPSEAEWEYACRAGTDSPFSTGETLTTDFANYCGEHTYLAEPPGVYRHRTIPAQQLLPNPFGCWEMHGSLWEFCADRWHVDYRGAPGDGRPWQSAGAPGYRVARGGSWHEPPAHCRSATRLRVRENEGDDTLGFRVALSL